MGGLAVASPLTSTRNAPSNEMTNDRWDFGTWEGARRLQLERALQLTVRERLQALGELWETSQRLRALGSLAASRHAPGPRGRKGVTTVRLALMRAPGGAGDGETRGAAPLEDAVKVGEVVRKAAMSRADDVPPVLSGHDMPDDPPHQHAFYLPEDADDDGRIDHVTVHAPAGLGEDALSALHDLSRLWLTDGVEWRVLVESYGDADVFDEHPYLSPARTWESVTPYLHPRYRKKSFTVEDQIRRELKARGLPAPELERMPSVEVGTRDRRPVHFHRFRSRRGLRQPDTKGSFWRLRFPEPVQGPIVLGFACHYGLGIFAGEEPG